MEPVVEKEFTALGSLFHHIITDLKNSAPAWEDFLLKATKFNSQLKSTILASTSFLDSFQKIADMATNTRGATKEIGSALTRLCLRQRSVEAKLKIFSNSLQEAVIIPLQEKLEEWKKMANYLDKEHSKEYKRAKQDLKKKSSDTLRLQKKVRKVGVVDIRRTLDCALQDVTDTYLLLEESEKQCVRKALIEERSHFCLFVGYLQPVLESEMTMLHEINHIQEIVDTLSKITGDPHMLPVTSEQVISDAKSSESTWSFQTPPGSPGSLGSRKSSVCSISSINSSSSGSLKSHSSKHLSHSQTLGRKHLNSVASHDSGFTSQDTLFMTNNAVTSGDFSSQLTTFQESGSTALSTPSSPLPGVTATWPDLQESSPQETETNNLLNKYQRPHTISSAYEKSNHNRPALTVHTFLPLDQGLESRDNYCTVGTFKSFGSKFKDRNCSSQPGTPVYSRPCLPERNDDSARPKPILPEKSATIKAKHNEPNKSVPDFNKTPPDQVVPHPVYANSNVLSSRHSASSDNLNLSRMDSSKEALNRKDFAAVLNEGLLIQSKWMRGENTASPVTAPPAIPKHCRPAVGNSETLPRSRGSLTDDQIFQWQMYAMSLSNDVGMLMHNGEQRRPMSIAGLSPGFLLPRKANTLQRVGSGVGTKPPPTPVRRSSSITSSASQSKLCEGNFSLKNDNHSVSSGAGEVRYTPNLKEFGKSNSQQEMFSQASLRHVEKPECYSEMASPSKDSSDSENSIVTDVSDSRARLIQDLNVAIRKQDSRRHGQNEAPVIPPRHSSKHEQNNPRLAENALYGHCGRQDKSPHTFSARPVLSQDIQQRPPRAIKDCLSQGDLVHCGIKDWTRSSNNGNELPDNEKQFKRSFVAALNAKLAEHHQENAEKQSTVSHWRNEKAYGTWNRYQARVCRESLMDQIKRGTRLRRVTCNDRSHPRLA